MWIQDAGNIQHFKRVSYNPPTMYEVLANGSGLLANRLELVDKSTYWPTG